MSRRHFPPTSSKVVRMGQRGVMDTDVEAISYVEVSRLYSNRHP